MGRSAEAREEEAVTEEEAAEEEVEEEASPGPPLPAEPKKERLLREGPADCRVPERPRVDLFFSLAVEAKRARAPATSADRVAPRGESVVVTSFFLCCQQPRR